MGFLRARIRTVILLFAAVMVTVTAIYLHNQRCFACEDNSDPTLPPCAYHNDPCTVANATLDFDECRTNQCADCNTCDNLMQFTCCYSARYRCNNDPHLHALMVHRECRTHCQPSIGAGGG